MKTFMLSLLRTSALCALLGTTLAATALAGPQPSHPTTMPADNFCQVMLDGEAELAYDADGLKKLAADTTPCPVGVTLDQTIEFVNKKLMNAFDDPYVHIVAPDEAKAMMEQFKGQHQAFNAGGIGANLSFDPTKHVTPAQPPKIDPETGKPEEAHLAFTGLIFHVVKGSPADKAGFKDGDIIVKVDGQVVTGLDAEHVVTDLLRGPLNSKVKVTIKRGTREITRTLTRDAVYADNVWSRDLGNGIYSIVITDFERQGTAGEILTEMLRVRDKARGFVLDVRGNPGGLLDEAIIAAGFFVKEGVLVSQRERVQGDPSKPEWNDITWKREGTDIVVTVKDDATGNTLETRKLSLMTQTIDEKTHKPVGKAKPFPFTQLAQGKPVVIVANGASASAAEVFTGALKENFNDDHARAKRQGATFIGTKTFGKFIGQSVVPGEAGTMFKATSFRYFSPKGEWLGDAYKHRIGMSPDIEVKAPDNFVPYTQTDAQVQAAVSFINKRLSQH